MINILKILLFVFLFTALGQLLDSKELIAKMVGIWEYYDKNGALIKSKNKIKEIKNIILFK